MKKFIYLLLSILVAISIFIFSSQDGEISSNVSSNLYMYLTNIKIFEVLFNIIPIRKFAHWFIYLILGLFVCFTFNSFNQKNIYIKTFIFCLLFAITDEIHQLFINGRCGNIIDVFIDCFGVLIGLLIIFIIKKSLEFKQVS